MENLKGKNIIERMNQLMNYGKTTKPAVKEGRNWADLEYSIKAPNGKTYGILRDQAKFYIKESIHDNPTVQDFEFIGGHINGSKKHYANYSHALSYLNLMIAEMNQKNPKSKSINLLECGYKEKPMDENKEKEVDEKTVLKLPQAPAAPAPAPQAAPAQQPKGNPGLDMGNDTEDNGDELDLGDEGHDEGSIGDSEEEKEIQKLTGKLGQKMRELDTPDADLTKYVMNSIMSALDLQDLDDSDQKQIMKKIKKKMSGEGEFDKTSDEDSDLDMGNDTEDNGDDFDFGDDTDTEDTGDNLDLGGNDNKQKEIGMKEISSGLANRASISAERKSWDADANEDPISTQKYRNQTKDFSAYINPQIKDEILRLGGGIIKKTSDFLTLSFDDVKISIRPDGYKIISGEVKNINPKTVQVLPRLIKKIQSDMDIDNNKPKSTEIQESDAPYGEKKDNQNIKSKNAPFSEKPKGIKTESRIQKTITKYFEYSPEEKQQMKMNSLKESKEKSMLLKEGKSKCKTVKQEIALTKVLDYDGNFQLKTMNESIVLDTQRKVNLGGKEYKKLVMIESNGKVSGILKDVETKTARQFRMIDKNDYINFIKLGK